jgi:hypothetical protein
MYVPAWFPGAEFQQWAKEARELFYKLTKGPFEETKKEMVSVRWAFYHLAMSYFTLILIYAR